jgi:hypothetical protein
MADWAGWLATAIFLTSYFFERPVTLRRIQGAGALAWLTYGVLIHAPPVIVANALVAGTAIWSSFLRRRQAGG